MKIYLEARSSMWEDLQRGRRTEIDYLQGVITEIADGAGCRRRCRIASGADPQGRKRRQGLARPDARTDQG